MTLNMTRAHLSHKPLFLFQTDVKKFGLIQYLIKGQEVGVAILMPCL